MAFTTWQAIRDDLKDAISDLAAGSPFTGSYTIGGRSMSFLTPADMQAYYEMTYKLENLDSSGDRTQMVSFARHRRF